MSSDLAVAQRTFGSGELGPALYPRCDLAKYLNGLMTSRNFLIARHGGAYNRPGTVFVGEIKSSATPGRLLPFIFNTTTGNVYEMEFGNQTLRFIQNGGYVLESSFAITAISLGATTTVTAPGHNFVNGDQVFLAGIVGTTQLNNRVFIVAGVAGNNFNLQTLDAVNLNSTGYTAYVSGGTAARLYTIATPYAAADLALVQYTQTADRVIFTHASYPVQQLIRSAPTSWAMSTVIFEPTTLNPLSMSGTVGAGGGTAQQRYQITAVSNATGEESLLGFTAFQNITGATQASTCVITCNAHGFVTGDQVLLTGISGMVQLNNGRFTVGAVTANTFELSGINSTGYTAYSAGGQVAGLQVSLANANTPSAAGPNKLVWAVVANATYNVYKQVSGSYILIGVVTSPAFSDVGIITAINSQTPPVFKQLFDQASGYHDLFSLPGYYPAACCTYQQRLILGGGTNTPTTITAGQVGNIFNFTSHFPQVDSDSFNFTLPGQQVSPVTHLQDFGQLIIYTQTAEYSAAGNSAGTLTPTGVNLKSYSTNGSNFLAPILVEMSTLYVQGRGWQVRDLAFDLIVQGYRGNEVNVYSSHLFYGFTIVDWAYQRVPNPTVWAVRSDGVLLGMTYVQSQQLSAWHRHDFLAAGGFVENVCVVPETATISGVTVSEDAVYLIVRRSINGRTVRYVERLTTRFVSDARNCIYMDCAITFDGRNSSATTMTLSGGTTWSYTENLTLTASAPTFGTWNVGDAVQLTGTDGSFVWATVQSITSSTVAVVKATSVQTVPVALQGLAAASWARAVTTVGGLWHLNGQNVSVLADGAVVANPNNLDYPVITVTNGQISLPAGAAPAAVIQVGLPYTSDLQTLDMDTAQGEPIAHKNKNVAEMTVYCEQSRGLWAGPAAPANDLVGRASGSGLVEGKFRKDEPLGSPPALLTGQLPTIPIQRKWNNNGRIFIRQSDPLPLAVTGVMPVGLLPFRGAA